MSPGELRKYEYLTGEDLGYRPSVLEQTKFDYSSLDKVFDKGFDDKDDQKEGILNRLKNFEKNQNVNNNNNNESEPSSARSKSSKKALVNEDEGEDENVNKKTECDIYQSSIEDMKGFELAGEIESKGKNSQIYVENNLNKTKNNFSDISDKYQIIFKYIANEEKYNIDYEILSISVEGVNFFDRHGNL